MNLPPNFHQDFNIKANASNIGVGLIFIQNGHLIAYVRKILSPKHQSLLAHNEKCLPFHCKKMGAISHAETVTIHPMSHDQPG